MVRCVLISDTHTMLNEVVLPPGDILIHAGDMTDIGDIEDVAKFAEDIKKVYLNYQYIIAIAGNHDFCFQNEMRETAIDILAEAGVNYLEDDYMVAMGLKIYGSPWQPWFYDWAFNSQRGKDIAAKWAQIPDDTQVLITHGPPYAILDRVPYGSEVGCVDLGKRIMNLNKLKLHVFGHIHHSYGKEVRGNITYVNAATCTESYYPTNPPIVIDL